MGQVSSGLTLHLCPHYLSRVVTPEITLTETQAVLCGVSATPVPLWNLTRRLDAASENVQAARALPLGRTPILLGVEHLPFLRDWPERPVVVIEKSASYHHHFQARYGAASATGPHIHLCVGDIGICSPLHFKSLRSAFYLEDVGALAFRLMDLPDTICTDTSIFGLPEHPWETEYLHFLHRTIHLVTQIKQFHHQMEPEYARYRQRPSTKVGGVLMRYSHEQVSTDKNFASFLSGTDIRFFACNPPPTNDATGFDIDYVSSNYRETAYATKLLEPTLASAHRLWIFLQEDRPQYIAYRNFSPFCAQQEIFLLQEMLHRLQIPARAYFMDVIGHMNYCYGGGWGLEPRCQRYTSSTTIFTCDPYTSSLHHPKTVSVGYYPYRYLHPRTPLQSPLACRDALELDVAIIHSFRGLSVAFGETNELYELVATFSPLAHGAAIPTFCVSLQRHLRCVTSGGFAHSAWWHSLRRCLDWWFHLQQRIRTVLPMSQRLSKYRLRVYGMYWDQLLPSAICGGSLTFEQADHVRRHAAVVIDCNPSFTLRLPHVCAVQSLAVGGLPLVRYPSFGDPGEPSLHAFDNTTLPYFRSLDELETLVNRFVHHIDERNAFIHHAQTTWLHDLQSGDLERRYHATKPVVVHPHTDPLPLTNDPATNTFLLEAGMGYLYSMSGYVATALQTWRTACAGEHRHLPLALRALKSAVEIQDWPHARHFLGLAREWAPSDPRVMQFSQRLRGLAGC